MGEPRMVRKRRYPALSCKAPYDNSVLAYLENGWPCPLPAGGTTMKEPLVSGYSGWKNDWKKVTKAKIKELHKKHSGNGYNIAQWLPPGILGIDVDHYEDKKGYDTLRKMEAELCPLPDTITSSARADGKSGIRYFKVPLELDLHGVGIIGRDIEAVHRGTRIAVVPPSYHPKVNDYYRWYDSGEAVDGTGSLDPVDIDLAEPLPPIWVDWIQNRKFSKHIPEKDFGSISKNRAAVDAWAAEHDGEPCAAMLKAVSFTIEALEERIQRHDTAYMSTYRLTCLAAEGHSGFDKIISDLYETFMRSRLGEDLNKAKDEWFRFVDGGVKRVMTREDGGDFFGFANPCRCPSLSPDGRPKPDLDLGKIDTSVAFPLCYEAMAARDDTGWYGAYRKGGVPVMRDADALVDIDADTMLEHVQRHVNCFKWAGGEEPIQIVTMPPKQFLQSLVKSREGMRALPEVVASVNTPFFTMIDGKPKLIHNNGYHSDAKVILDMSPELELAVDNYRETPTTSDLRWAKQWIEETISEFPFVTPADRATFYAALIQPFVRDLISGTTPAYLFDAPMEGTGKGLICDVIGMVVCGGLSPVDGREFFGMPKGSEREYQINTKLDSALLKMPKIIQLDNVSGTVDSPTLAMALTAEYVSVRLLNSNVMAPVPNRSLWLLNGNNFKATGEIQRRIVPCHMDAGVPDPAGTRVFKIKDLKQHVRDNRARLVWSVMTLVSNWIEQGMPSGLVGDRPRLGSFSRWEEVVGGILKANGINGLLDNLENFRSEATSEYNSILELLEQWDTFLGVGVKVSPREIVETLPIAQETIEGMKGSKSANVGVVLSKYVNVPQGKYVLRHQRPKGASRYWLELLGKPIVFRKGRPRRVRAVSG